MIIYGKKENRPARDLVNIVRARSLLKFFPNLPSGTHICVKKVKVTFPRRCSLSGRWVYLSHGWEYNVVNNTGGCYAQAFMDKQSYIERKLTNHGRDTCKLMWTILLDYLGLNEQMYSK